MTSEQRAALQALAGRDLTQLELDSIEPYLADPENRNDVAIAALLTTMRAPKIVSTEIGIGTILATLGAAGGEFLDGLVALGETNRNVYWSMQLIRQGRFDVGMAATREQMQALAQTLPQEQAGAFSLLMALAERPDTVAFGEVSVMLNDAEGRMQL